MSGVILLGGGLDSTSLLLHLVREGKSLTGFHVQYGQRADLLELSAVKFWCDRLNVPLKVFTMPLNEIAESAILRQGHTDFPAHSNKLEGRNVIFTMLAATYAATIGATELYLGYHHEPKDAPFPDATQQAVDAMGVVLHFAYKQPIDIITPFGTWTRTKILRRGYELDELILNRTHTCYEGVSGGCGRCAHCRQRATMIRNLLTNQDAPLEENR